MLGRHSSDDVNWYNRFEYLTDIPRESHKR